MSTKSKEWQLFKKCREDIMSGYTRPEQSAMKQKWTDECLVPLGYNHEFEFVRCKEKSDDEKAKLFNEWSDMFKDGKFNPDRRKKVTKKVKPKRGASLDDLSLDEPVVNKPDTINIKEPTEVDEVVDQQVKEIPDLVELDGAGMTEEEKEAEDYEVTKFPKAPPTEQEKWEALPVKERAKITIEKQKPKPKEDKMPKSKKELLLEAISALEEEENAGITEEQVEEISKRVAVKVFTDLFSEVSETITSTLSSYAEDTKNQ